MSTTLLQLVHGVVLALATRNLASRAIRRPQRRPQLEPSGRSGADGNIDAGDPGAAKARLYYSHRLGELTRILAGDVPGGRRQAACRRHAHRRGSRRSPSPYR